MKHWTGAAIIALCAAVLAAGLWRTGSRQEARTVAAMPQTGYILIDPGHGGLDSGAVASDGTKEKTLNLAIALDLRDVLTVLGFPVRMTRADDRDLGDADASTIRAKKISDMNNRLALYQNAALVLSIHQNTFGQSIYSGAQVFYGPQNPASKPLADAVQQCLRDMLEPDNHRLPKRAGGDIFLLYNTTVPAVIVECGFLSNPPELAKLKTPDYQRALAFAVTRGVLEQAE
ncbi:MAG: N-acetylmuramoyl-L-alanine amidase [Oscillospiraceae bacterium]|nr:N-acetylmuramoyl-L-alanine amidase [Oscillospiraceae bacterium]